MNIKLRILLLLYIKPGLTSGEIIKTLGNPETTIRPILTKLKKSGLITQNSNKYYLTDIGKGYLTSIQPILKYRDYMLGIVITNIIMSVIFTTLVLLYGIVYLSTLGVLGILIYETGVTVFALTMIFREINSMLERESKKKDIYLKKEK